MLGWWWRWLGRTSASAQLSLPLDRSDPFEGQECLSGEGKGVVHYYRHYFMYYYKYYYMYYSMKLVSLTKPA